MLKFLYTCFFLFLFSFLGKGIWLFGQSLPWRNVYIMPQEKKLRLHLEIAANFNYAFPRAFTKKQGFLATDGGQAKAGWGAEILLQHRFRRNALWSVFVLAAYQNLAFQNKIDVIDKFAPNSNASQFSGKDYTALYFMPNVAFRAGVKWKFECTFGLGLGFVNGGVEEQKLWTLPNPLSQTNMIYNVKNWQSKTALVKGFRWSATWGYFFQKRYLIAAQIGLLQLSGKTTTQLAESQYLWDKDLAQIVQTLAMGTYQVKRKIQYQSWFVGLSFKYQIYKSLYPHTITKNGIIYH